MLELHHGSEPPILQQFKAQYTGEYTSKTWQEYKNFESKTTSDKPLIHALHALQEGLCVYCERPVFSTAPNQKRDELPHHIEHLLPKSKFPQKVLTYTNLALSCTQEGSRRTLTCGAKKAEQELPILPTQQHSHLFQLDVSSGRLIPASTIPATEAQKVSACIDILNLNYGKLCYQRARITETVQKIFLDTTIPAEQKQQSITAYCKMKTAHGQPFAHTLRNVFAALLS